MAVRPRSGRTALRRSTSWCTPTSPRGSRRRGLCRPSMTKPTAHRKSGALARSAPSFTSIGATASSP
eukprot:3889195-Alexandrium_andersonii.AAC.1